MKTGQLVLIAGLVAGSLLIGGGPATAAPAPAPANAETGSTYTPQAPLRVLDTRTGSPVGPDRTMVLDLSSRIPADATAVVLNVTGVTPTKETWFATYALRDDGTVWGWGSAERGSLGAGHECVPGSCTRNTPVQIAGPAGISAIGDAIAVR